VTCMIMTASMSFIASFIVAIMVFRSRTVLHSGPYSSLPTLAVSPYHRIILGLSLSDMLQSGGLLTGPFMAPAYVPQALWGIGNNASCRINGLVLSMGQVGTMMYTCFLCYYSLCRIKKFNVTDDSFRNQERIEWKVHTFILAFMSAVGTATVATNTLNTYAGGSHCTIAAVPAGCRQNPEIFGECEEAISKHVVPLSIVFHLVVPFLCISGIIVCMVKIYWYVMITRTRIFRGPATADHRDRDRSVIGTLRVLRRSAFLRNSKCSSINKKEEGTDEGADANADADADADLESKSRHDTTIVLTTSTQQSTSGGGQPQAQPVAHVRDSSEDLVKFYKREIIIQACLYVATFFVTYIYLWCLMFANIIAHQTPSVWMNCLASIFYPIGGFFNILVYTRPKVVSLRRSHPEYSWFQAFAMVVKAGAVVPMVVVEDSRRPSSSSCSIVSTRNDAVHASTPDFERREFIVSSLDAESPPPTTHIFEPHAVEASIVGSGFALPPPSSISALLDSSESHSTDDGCQPADLLSLGMMNTINEECEDDDENKL
jgi:hypothetical protein